MKNEIQKISDTEIGIPQEIIVASLDSLIAEQTEKQGLVDYFTEEIATDQNKIIDLQNRLDKIASLIISARELGVKTTNEVDAERKAEAPQDAKVANLGDELKK